MREALGNIGLEEASIQSLIAFSKRRGYSWDADERDEKAEKSEEDNFLFSVHRDEFFKHLEQEISRILLPDQRGKVFSVCQKILNREIRPARFKNRRPTQCRWEGCNRNVPAARNALRARIRQSFYLKLMPMLRELADKEEEYKNFLQQLDAFLENFATMSEQFQKEIRAEKNNGPKAKDSDLKNCYKNTKAGFKKFLISIQTAIDEKEVENLKSNFQKYYGKELDDLVKKKQSGRVSFCRDHSEQFIEFTLAGKVIPYKKDLRDKDIISRQQQIIFNKIWRFIEARLLPLAGGGIDEVVVERNAFDLLAMPFKDKRELSEDKANELYWLGPRYGYQSAKEMLFREFDGRCAYCGSKFPEDQFVEVEHILPRAQFGYNNYFNLTLACRECNQRKGSQSPLASGLTIHENAYQAYSAYVAERERQGLRHTFHTIKKGILNLLQQQKADRAETVLSIIGQNLLEATATQKSPRPLARFLATKLNHKTGDMPQIRYVAGRHTAVYRDVLFPEFDKLADKLSQNKDDCINHALDAILVGLNMPDLAMLERGYYAHRDFKEWSQKALSMKPAVAEDGLPKFEPPDPIIGFENASTINSSFYQIDLLSTAWNKKDSATHQQNPYGLTRQGEPIKKKSAAGVIKELLEEKKSKKRPEKKEDIEEYIKRISHLNLRKALLQAIQGEQELESVKKKAGLALIRWLQKSIGSSLQGSAFSSHPGSQARKEYLEAFVQSRPEEILEQPAAKIPPNVSIRMLDSGVKGKVDLTRLDKKSGKILHAYMCQPRIKMKILGYKALTGGSPDRNRPEVLTVLQNWSVKADQKNSGLEEQAWAKGRALSGAMKEKEFLEEWNRELKRYLASRFSEWHTISPGCYVQYANGGGRFIRNFDKSDEFKNEVLKGIIKVHRSPYAWLKKT